MVNIEELRSKGMSDGEIANYLAENYSEKVIDEILDKDGDRVFWVAKKLFEIKRNGCSKDGIEYPSTGYVTDEFFTPLEKITVQLNRLHGVHCDGGAIYAQGTCDGTKGFWSIDFDSISDLNHFLWAGCHRYFPITDSNLWRMQAYVSDPIYSETKLRLELHYLPVDAVKEQIVSDIDNFAMGVENYADDEKVIADGFSTVSE